MFAFPDRLVNMAGYDFYLNRAVTQDAQPDIHSGASGYFSVPQRTLDPHIFDGQRLKDAVRDHITGVLYAYWDYNLARSWSGVWLAGSGITYQWAGDRGNGDLDVMIGVDFPAFRRANPVSQGFSDEEIADYITSDLKKNLWPRTAKTHFNGQTYEVTYYLSPQANSNSSILGIHPYAAYNLITNRWDVRPPELPDDPRSLYPAEWKAAIDEEAKQAQAIVSRYTALRSEAASAAPNSTRWKNALSSQHLVVTQAKALFDSIHLGRHNAFSATGKGYGDFYNYRWQSHKESGTVQALYDLAQMDADARNATETYLYGRPLDDAHTAITKAVLWEQRRGR